MVICVLIALSVLSYDQADDHPARRFSWDSIFSPGARNATNALGLTGAAIARLLVPGFLGYCVLLLPAVGSLWGYNWLRHRTSEHLKLATFLIFAGAYLSATFFGWLTMSLESDLLLWSGAWGLGTAGWMQRVFGTSGSAILILATLLVTSLLLIDRDIQRSMDRIENRFGVARDGLGGWWTGRKDRKAAKIAAQEQLLEEKQLDRKSVE